MHVRTSPARPARSVALTALLALVAALTLAGCSGSDSSSGSSDDPAAALAAAKKALDDTSGVHLEITSENVPADTTALLGASGDGTHAPAFDGQIKVAFSGLEPTVPVIAVDGKVYAQVPLSPGWQTIDPKEFGAPDPSTLLAKDGGFSSLLTATTGPTKGEQVRGGEDNKEVLTTYTGTIDQTAAKTILPGATGDFDVTYTIGEGDQLRTMKVVGDFYGKGSDTTYTIAFSDYGSNPTITAPDTK